MTVLVLGSGGQLARHLRAHLPTATFAGRNSLDLTDTAAIAGYLEALDPSCIINAAAYTHVDGAEGDGSAAWRINADAVAAIARTAQQMAVPLLHVSSDYVFDGTAQRAYTEQDSPNPINVYGASKLAGELAVRSLCKRYWIVRASWVFSEHGSNFVTAMLRLARERDTLRVVHDQLGRPTYAGDLAALLARLAGDADGPSLPWGVYHLAGGTAVSWAEFAETIVRRAHAAGHIEVVPAVQRLTTAEYPTAAARPRRAVLDGRLLQSRLGDGLADWSVGLDAVLERLS